MFSQSRGLLSLIWLFGDLKLCCVGMKYEGMNTQSLFSISVTTNMYFNNYKSILLHELFFCLFFQTGE